MDAIHLIFYLFLILAIIGLIVGIDSFVKHKKNETKNKTTFNNAPANNTNQQMSAGMTIFVIILFIGFVALAIVGIWVSLKRYQLASEAIEKGDTGTAIAALSPEIGEGVGSVIGGIGSAFRG